MPKIKFNCIVCGKEVLDYPSNRSKFCSKECSHNSRKGKGNSMYGKKHSKKTKENWSKKRRMFKIKSNGYILNYMPKHPFCDSTGHVKEHRLVIEKYLGRYLTSKEVVHHVNSNRWDNRIENLMLLESQSKHRGLHNKKENIEIIYGKLGKIEKEKCKWLLENKIFSKIFIASKKINGRKIEIVYKKFI